MSCSLHWKPTGGGKRVDTDGGALRDAIREEYGYPITLTVGDIPFLRGLRAAKISDADKLIELIGEHDSIDLWTEC